MQRAQARIRAARVCIQYCPGRRIETRNGIPRDVAKSMPPQLAIGREQCGTQQGGELAGRGAVQEIHLKEPILCVQIAEPECEIVSILCRDGRHAVGVAVHAYACMDAGTRLAVEDGKARSQHEPRRKGPEQ